MTAPMDVPVKSLDEAGSWDKTSFGWAWPVLKHGYQGDLTAAHVSAVMGTEDHAEHLWNDIERVRRERQPSDSAEPWLLRALVRLHRFTMLKHAAWCLTEVVVRVGGPLILREFLMELEDVGKSRSADTRLLWLYAILLGIAGAGLVFTHHVLFWIGMRLGFHLRTQMMACIHSKVLRLNSKAISSITTGQVVNLLSNDVRRFDDVGPFWVFLWAGPLETLFVTIIIALDLGWLATIASMSALILLIPVQSTVAKYIGRVRRETAALTDRRVHIVNEVISGITACKMYVWEESFLRIIQGLRREEVASITRINVLRAFNAAMFFVSIGLVSFIAFGIYTAQGGTLTMARISYVLALLQLPRLSLANFFVRGVETTSEARVSISRIERFLNLPEPAELDTNAQIGRVVPDNAAEQPVRVLFRGGVFEWEGAPEQAEQAEAGGADKVAAFGDVFKLRLPRFGVRQGELIGVCGTVGAGKSSMLAAMLQEMTPAGGLSTAPVLCGSVAYCAQQSWIIAGTVRENVLFGLAMDPTRYAETLEACALDADIALFPSGDLTELGERGVNLSGGQKARLALARAAYSQADIMLLDDPLSAVDPPVGQHLFTRCIRGPLMRNKTVFLVTHQTQFLPHCNRVMLLRAGELPAWVEPSDLVGNQLNQELARAIREHDEPVSPADGVQSRRVSLEEALGVVQNSGGSSLDLPTNSGVSTMARVSLDDALGALEGNSNDGASSVDTLPQPISPANPREHLNPMYTPTKESAVDMDGTGKSATGACTPPKQDMGQLVTTERKEVGGVRRTVYTEYTRYCGYAATALVCALLVGGNTLHLAQEMWLAAWTSSDNQEEARWIDTFAGLTVGLVVVGVLRAQLTFHLCLQASRAIHQDMTARVLRAPLVFFHANPTGRILNRFSKDLGTADEVLPNILFDTLQCGGDVLGAILLTVIAVPLVTPMLVPLYWVFNRVRQYYAATSRDVKREEALSRSPIYSSFSATLKGLATIRAYKAQERYHDTFLHLLDQNGCWWVAFMGTARWFGFRLDLITAALLFIAVVLVAALREFVSVDLVGISLAHVLQLSGLLQWFMRQTAETENNFTSVERLLEYTKLDQEPPWVKHGGKLPPVQGWPRSGRLQFEGVYATYRPTLPPVLRGLSFEVQPGELCGIGGRTGSGKSSLLLSLYRMIDITQGRVVLDGVDCASIGLDVLRKSLAIIPQDPVLFSGSFRHNLDPFDQHQDAQLWEVLSLVQLKQAVEDLGGGGSTFDSPGGNSGSSGLYAVMAECGDNLSTGQKQLVCLARAMLRKAKVFALDEATANVDTATDALIQEALRKSIKATDEGSPAVTALIIAHRLNTIIDCNQILVLSDGVAIEQGRPDVLAATPNSVFGNLLKSAGLLELAARAHV